MGLQSESDLEGRAFVVKGGVGRLMSMRAGIETAHGLGLSLRILLDFLSRRVFSMWRILLVRSLSHLVKDGWLLLADSSVVSESILLHRSLHRDSLFSISLVINLYYIHTNITPTRSQTMNHF